MNRVIYSSVQIIPFGWGLHKKAKNEYDYHSLIRRTKVIIQKKNTIIRKKRKYYIVTAYPDIQKSLQDGYSFVSTTNFSIGWESKEEIKTIIFYVFHFKTAREQGQLVWSSL